MNIHLQPTAVTAQTTTPTLAPTSPARRPSTTSASRSGPRLDRMVDLYAELLRVSYEFEPMPDEVSDHLGEARTLLAQAVAAAPARTGADIAWKLRLAAMLVEDDEGGPMYAETDILNAAVEGLEAVRSRTCSLTYGDMFPVGATVHIAGHPPLIVNRLVDELPGVELVRDGEHYLTVNPRWLVEIGAAVRFPEAAQ